MKDKEIIKKAISYSGIYTIYQCQILEALVDLSVNNIVIVNVKHLEELTGVKVPTIYFALKMFQKDNLLLKSPTVPNTFTFNEKKFEPIIALYQAKLNYMGSNET